MYITCEQCNTIFQLDEKRLKPTGSKVRCSQCGNLFIAVPPNVEEMGEMLTAPVAPSESVPSAEPPLDSLDQELEGIDIAELDSILEKERSEERVTLSESDEDTTDQELSELNELDESDFNFDFESALEQGDELQDIQMTPSVQKDEDSDDETALDMDFDLDLDEADLTTEASDQKDLFDDMEMDFELEDSESDKSEDVFAKSEEDDFTEDIDESVLDEFEDALGQSEETLDEGELPMETSEEAFSLDDDFEFALDDAPADAEDQGASFDRSESDKAKALAGESEEIETDDDFFDLGDIDKLIDEEGPASQAEVEEVELSLADDGDESASVNTPDTTKAAGQKADGFDLSDLSGLLDEKMEPDDTASFSVQEEPELDLDEEPLLELSDDDLHIKDAEPAKKTAGEPDRSVTDEEPLLELSDDDLLIKDTEPAQKTAGEPDSVVTDEEPLLELSDDDLFAGDTKPAKATADEEPLLDLSEDEIQPEAKGKAEEPALDLLDDDFLKEVSKDQAVSQSDQFDLEGFDDILDEEQELSLDEELSLDLDSGGDDVTQQRKISEKDDLFELSGIDHPIGKSDDQTATVEEGGTLEFSTKASEKEEQFELTGIDHLLGESDDQAAAVEEGGTLEFSTKASEKSEDFELTGIDHQFSSEKDEDFELTGIDHLLGESDDQAAAVDESGMLEFSLDDEMKETEDSESALELTLDDETTDEDLGTLEELDFDLDAEFEEKPVSKTAPTQGNETPPDEDEAEDGEIDLSDIEKMLEDETLVPEKKEGAPAPGDDLKLEPAEDDLSSDTSTDDFGFGLDEEIDLTDIEAAIDSADKEPQSAIDTDEELLLELEADEAPSAAQDDEFELSLEMEENGKPESPKNGTEAEMEALDFSDLELSMDDDVPAVQSDIVDGGDIELEFQIEEDELEPPTVRTTAGVPAAAAQATTSGVTVDKDQAAAVEKRDNDLIAEAFTPPVTEEKKPIEKPVAAPKKKAVGLPVIIVLIIVLLVGGGYFGFDYIKKNNIRIPFLSDYINPQPKDPKNIAMLSTLEINSKFMENESAGRIFVVTGKVRNGYSTPCKMIRLLGKLFMKGEGEANGARQLAKTEATFAGVIISDHELAGQDLQQLKQRLKSPSPQDVGVIAKSGQSLPFMVIFSDLPENLEEFTVEVESSEKL